MDEFDLNTKTLEDRIDILERALDRNLRIRHLFDHPRCKPGPVEECPDRDYQRQVAILNGGK